MVYKNSQNTKRKRSSQILKKKNRIKIKIGDQRETQKIENNLIRFK